MIEILEIEKMPFILGNEFYSINGPYVKSTKLGDYSEHVAERVISSDLFLSFYMMKLNINKYTAILTGLISRDMNGRIHVVRMRI